MAALWFVAGVLVAFGIIFLVSMAYSIGEKEGRKKNTPPKDPTEGT